jgi:hypothetical protein
MKIIPNGVDYRTLVGAQVAADAPPTVALVGRVVPIRISRPICMRSSWCARSFS